MRVVIVYLQPVSFIVAPLRPWLGPGNVHMCKWFGKIFFFVCFYLNLFIFNWRIIALQCCVGFCDTST